MKYFDGSKRFMNLSKIVRLVLNMLNGNSSLERGFSINENVLWDNMQAESLISKRIIINHMKAHNLEAYTIPLTRELMKDVRHAYSRYENRLSKKREEKKKNQKS